MKKFFQEMWREDPRSTVLFIVGMVLILLMPLFYCLLCYSSGIPVFQ